MHTALCHDWLHPLFYLNKISKELLKMSLANFCACVIPWNWVSLSIPQAIIASVKLWMFPHLVVVLGPLWIVNKLIISVYLFWWFSCTPRELNYIIIRNLFFQYVFRMCTQFIFIFIFIMIFYCIFILFFVHLHQSNIHKWILRKDIFVIWVG